jgi:hypothetical protein
VARLATQTPGRVPDLGPLTEGPGPTNDLRSLPSPRVACRCSPVGFDQQHILACPVGLSSSTTSTSADGKMREDLITYEELPAEHKQKYDEIKALSEADLIGSFEKTRHHGVRWKGFSPKGALDDVVLSTPSEDHTRSLRQEVNYMVAHSLHRHSESLVNAFKRVALRVVQEIMKHQYSPTDLPWGVIRENYHSRLSHRCLMRSRLRSQTAPWPTSSTRWEVTLWITSSSVSRPRRSRTGMCVLIYWTATIRYIRCRGWLEEFPVQMLTNKRG